jgi:ubiquinone/menaquinone biosynthesis C-methylase UbiE
MNIMNSLYCRLHRFFSKETERGEYSGGAWQDLTRSAALEFCRGTQGKVLEIGCGEGLFVSQLKQRYPDLGVWGVDNDNRRLQQAGARAAALGLQIHLSTEDAVRLSFSDGYFDAVVCINVLFNMDSLETVTKVVAEMRRVCRRGGKIIFDFRNSLNPVLEVKYGLARYYDETVRDIHLKTYSLTEIENTAARAGLKIIRTRCIGFFIARYAPIIVVEATQ